MKPFRPVLLLVAALAFATSCGDDEPVGPEDRTGSLSFGYTGERSGVFTANGELRIGTDNNIQAGSWGAALRDTDGLTLVAFQPTASPRGTLFLAALGTVAQPGTITLTCAPGVACSSGVEFKPNGPVSSGDSMFVLVAGSVLVDTLTSTRIAGRFSASTQYTANNSGARDSTRALVISDGRFSLPIRDDLN